MFKFRFSNGSTLEPPCDVTTEFLFFPELGGWGGKGVLEFRMTEVSRQEQWRNFFGRL